MKLETLFSPGKIGNVSIRNRFVMPPMGNNFANTDGTLSERSARYYEARAKGGFGLITIEATVVDETAKGGYRKPCLFSDETIESFRYTAKLCHEAGAKVSVQLQHAGPEGNTEVTGFPLRAASPIASHCGGEVPQEFPREELYLLAEKYGDAARRAQQAGIDMVELHCAHGYLLHTFLSPRTNQRLDEFGGCLENRLRLVGLVIENIRRKTDGKLPILCRINGCDDLPGGLTVQDSAVIAASLEEMGVDALHVSRSTHLHDETMWAPGSQSGGFSADILEKIKEAVQIPVITVGRFTEPAYGELLLRQKKCDFVSFGRQSIADPELPNKAAQGRMTEVMPCVGCLQGCVPNLFAGKPITCLANPGVGYEMDALKPAAEKKKVLVVGGGVGGLTVAQACAQRGHHVLLCEKNQQLGGQMRTAAIPPGKSSLTGLLQAMIRGCAETGVSIQTNVEVTPQFLEKEKPDVLVVAAGSQPVLPPIPGMETITPVFAEEVLNGNVRCGERVFVLGGGLVGCETAAFLSQRKHQVTIFDRRPVLGAGESVEHWKFLDSVLRDGEVRRVTDAVVTRVDSDHVWCRSQRVTTQYSGYDTLVIALGRRSDHALMTYGKALVPECYEIGDARQPGMAMAAIEEGYRLAKTI